MKVPKKIIALIMISSIINLTGLELVNAQVSDVSNTQGSKYEEVISSFADTSWYDSSKTEFEITTMNQFAGLAKLVNEGNRFKGKTVKLGSDIDLQNHVWTPIGSDEDHPFQGIFDGCGHEIKNLNLSNKYDEYIGLFGYIKNATIKNIGIASGEIYIKNCTNALYVGSIVADIEETGTIENCYNKADITLEETGGYIGGIVGSVWGIYSNTKFNISNCHNEGNIKINTSNFYERSYVGGIMGLGANISRYKSTTDTLRIENCYNLGSIIQTNKDTNQYLAGIVGQFKSGTLNRCYNLGKIDSNAGKESTHIAGLFAVDYTLQDITSLFKVQNCGYIKNKGVKGVTIGTMAQADMGVSGVKGPLNDVEGEYESKTSDELCKLIGIDPIPIKESTIIFDANNGTSNVIKEVDKDSPLDYIPETPEKAGYVFVGWFRDVNNITTEYKSNTIHNEDTTYTAKYAHVQMLGAQGKNIVNGKSGIRFGTKVYNDGDKIIEKGTLIIPSNLLGEQTLTLDNTSAVKSVAKVLYETNKDENYEVYLGTLINIPESQFGRAMTASAYVIYEDSLGNEYTIYSPYSNGDISINQLLKNNF